MAVVDTLRLVGSPETNKVMAGELSRLSRRALSVVPPQPRKQGTGSLVYPFDAALAALAVHYHRTSTRVLWDLCESRASRLEPLYEELCADLAGDGRGWLWDGATISVRARNVGAFAAGERQVVGTVKNAVVDGAAARGLTVSIDPDDPDVAIAVRMHDDTVSVAVDLAGASLSQRGYRTERATASLREHLAAVMIMLARHDPRTETLIDPMCGAGTIAIEAALMARGAPLWVPPRRPALARLPAFRDVVAATGPLFADARVRVFASDVDPEAVAMARRNAAAAGVEGIRFASEDFRDLSRAALLGADDDGAPGLILSNPPYGERLDGRDVLALYDQLGEWCRQFPGWRAAFLVANPGFERAFGYRPRITKPLNNGPLRATFYVYDL
jgi:23S rRNA G2445 N2-methylase RlmL